jgi:hydrogenase maturation factor
MSRIDEHEAEKTLALLAELGEQQAELMVLAGAEETEAAG